MSEQPAGSSKIIQFSANHLEDDAQFDLHKNVTVPNYNSAEIARVHSMEAARRAREAALAAEEEARLSPVELAGADLARLAAVRNAAISGQIRIAA